MKVAAILFLGLIFFLTLISCKVLDVSRPAKINSIALRIQTGLLGQTYQITIKNNGQASLECKFYELNSDGKPRMNAKMLCDQLLEQMPKGFREVKGDLEGKFVGNVSEVVFSDLVKLLNEKNYFSMTDGYEFDGRLDAPPSFVDVEFDGGKKSVGDKARNNEELHSIKEAIKEQGQAIEWRIQ